MRRKRRPREVLDDGVESNRQLLLSGDRPDATARVHAASSGGKRLKLVMTSPRQGENVHILAASLHDVPEAGNARASEQAAAADDKSSVCALVHRILGCRQRSGIRDLVIVITK